MFTWMLALALAASPEFTEVKQTAGCTLFKGAAGDEGIAPMRAECHWSEIKPESLWALMDTPQDFAELIFAITRSEPIRAVEGRILVHQVQAIRGIADREVLLWMDWNTESMPRRVRWTTASEQPLDAHPDRVRMTRNEGAWSVGPHPDGGSMVVHEISVLPGGSVPAWLARWLSVGGLAQIMTEVRAKAASGA